MRFGVLGPVTATADGREIPLPAPMVRSLLGLLLVEAGRLVPEARIARVLWGDQPPRTARASMHNHVLRLRRSLGDQDARIIRRTPDGYLLAVGAGGLDLTEFDALRGRGAEALTAGRWAEAESMLSEALALWRDVPLADVSPAARDAIDVRHISEAGLHTRELLGRARLRLGRFDQVVGDVQPLADEHPWRETLAGLLMHALYGAGRQADALKVYRDLRQRLIDELGVEPSPEIRDLLQRILREEPGLRSPDAPEGIREPAVSRNAARSVVPAQLPADVADFSGRASLIGDLIRILSETSSAERAMANGEVQPRPLAVVAITGTGGVGKTALALHAAHRLAPGFPDGQLFVDLAGASKTPRDPAEILENLLVALGLPEQDVPPGVEARGAEFRSRTSGRRILLVLDDARDAAQIRPLLPGSGSCAVVATSRNRLPGLAGAASLPLDVMDAEEGRALFAAIVASERADAEPRSRDDIIDYCAGLPLAIRIAASRLASRPSWTIADLATRLADERDRLDELAVEDVAVRASFCVSYTNLGDPGLPATGDRARAFRLLGLWPGDDLAHAAIAALVGTSSGQAGRLLEALTDANLVDHRVADRYRLHDLLRIYSRELVESVDPPEHAEQAIAGLLSWYTHTAAAAADRFVPGRFRYGLDLVPFSPTALTFSDLASATAWLRTERSNLRAACALAAEQKGNAAAWVLPAQLKQVYALCGFWRDLEETHAIGLDAAERLNDPLGQCHMHAGLSVAMSRLGRHEEALEAARKSHDWASATGDPVLTAITMGNHAVCLSGAGKDDEAAAWHAKALPAVRAVGNLGLLAASLINAGDCYLTVRAYPEAAAAFREALVTVGITHNRHQEAMALRGLGEAEYLLGDGPAAVVTLQMALSLTETLGDPAGSARCHDRLGDALLASGEPEAAREAWREALRLWEEIDGAEADAVRVKLSRGDISPRR